MRGSPTPEYDSGLAPSQQVMYVPPPPLTPERWRFFETFFRRMIWVIYALAALGVGQLATTLQAREFSPLFGTAISHTNVTPLMVLLGGLPG